MQLRMMLILGLVTTIPVNARASRDIDDACALIEVSAGRRPTLTIVNGNGDLELTKRRGRITAALDGRELPEQALLREGNTLRIVDDGGETLYMVVLRREPGPDGQLIYVPDLDPDSAHARLGLRTAPLEEDAARVLGRDPGDGLQVTGLCAGRSADAAGLREGDVIVGIHGQGGVTRESLNRAVGVLGEGERLELGILRAGRRRTISLSAAQPGDWPPADRLEGYVRDALRP